MLLIAAAAFAADHDVAVTGVPPGKPAMCLRTSAYVAGAETRYDGKPLTPRKLTELPPANEYVAVLRVDENGCLAPIVVKYDIGR
jgi:hypothetical protein